MRIKNIDPTTLYIPDPVGEIKRIQDLQKAFQTKVNWVEKSFGKAYRSEIQDGEYVPEVYYGNDEYIEVLPDDEVTGMCFFDVQDEITVTANNTFDANINIVFFVNLKKAFPLLLHRADTEVRQDIINVIKKHQRGWEMNTIITGVENVYSRYGWTEPEALIDKQPYHVFSIECNVRYDCYIR